MTCFADVSRRAQLARAAQADDEWEEGALLAEITQQKKLVGVIGAAAQTASDEAYWLNQRVSVESMSQLLFDHVDLYTVTHVLFTTNLDMWVGSRNFAYTIEKLR